MVSQTRFERLRAMSPEQREAVLAAMSAASEAQQAFLAARGSISTAGGTPCVAREVSKKPETLDVGILTN